MTTLVVVFEEQGHPPRGHLLVPGQEQVDFHGWLTLLGSMEAALARREVVGRHAQRARHAMSAPVGAPTPGLEDAASPTA